MSDPASLAEDLQAWRQIGDQLRSAVVGAFPSWLERSVHTVMHQQGLTAPPDLAHQVAEAAERGAQFVDRSLAALFATDPDEQRGTPLGVMRDAVRFPTEILDGLGATRIKRGDMDRWSIPNDHYNITPANMGALSPEAQELSIAWGAGKAHIHLKRRRQS